MKITAYILAVTLLLTTLLSCGAAKTEQNGISVVTTCFPLYDFAREILGDEGNVTLLLKPGQDAHSFEPSAKQIGSIKDCDLFLIIGGEDESWAKALTSSSSLENTNVLSVIDRFVSEGSHLHDEHIWTSPKNAIIIAEQICDALSEISPENKDFFRSNTDGYIAELEKLDEAFASLSRESAGKTVVFGDRFPFTHLFEDYDISYVSVFPGCSEMTEPSASVMADIIGIVKENNIGTVFITQFSNGAVADAICEETGAKKALLHSCANITKDESKENVTYLSLMKNNVEALKKALE